MCFGILDRHPHISIILGHCAEALPFLIHRIDHRLAIGTPGANGPHKKIMLEYFQNNFYATLAGVRRLITLRDVLEELGEERVLSSIDYPFEKTEEAAEWFDGLEINANTRRAIATGNAKRLFRLG
jgi:predicted TIM-barrel fold metal-dependent hydrolase